ncbi:Trk-type K+ transport system membrane component [Enterococcus sp. PF1-24]|uniref:TrkH family potassium uptake protein n=1 Tax=unclassified Enterococcus TaxID=2608891 RepID=UPI0024737012|nr:MULTISPECIES: TrkH family potassium uptake protein [unclassified Enterococcus]MDH6365388.1 Trk-type K+ transport system membrane component [Enterococcus sp. PFB1-1]MDH6402489.1 Trk-type K+ transport system membrane component [Enterococcus sp. PF1-24]
MNVNHFIRKKARAFSRFSAKHFTSIQIIVIYYVIMTLLTMFLFSLPIFRKADSHISLMDLFFMAVSTVSVTGLTTFNINDVFNEAGIILLEVMFQIGGLGIMMISTFFFMISKRRITLKQRQLIMTDMNQPKLSGVVKMIRITLGILVFFQLIFGVFFSIYFHIKDYYDNLFDTIFHGFYQSISAVTNSGFDITGNSIMPFANDYLFLIVIMFLIFIGGIGFPVLMECYEWFTFKKTKHNLPFRFSLFAKIAMWSFVILFIGGALAIYLLEKDHYLAGKSPLEQGIISMFYSMTTRNAGLQINPLGDFQISTLLLFSCLMFIGCSPSSVGGGIRTTTIAILFLSIISFLKGESNVNIFGRKIPDEDVRKSMVIFMLSLGMCFASVLFLSATENHTLISIILEVASAFGTTGLSLGITPNLSTSGQLTIALLMFIGRVGMLYTLMLFVPKERRDSGYEYPTEKIIIG